MSSPSLSYWREESCGRVTEEVTERQRTPKTNQQTEPRRGLRLPLPAHLASKKGKCCSLNFTVVCPFFFLHKWKCMSTVSMQNIVVTTAASRHCVPVIHTSGIWRQVGASSTQPRQKTSHEGKGLTRKHKNLRLFYKSWKHTTATMQLHFQETNSSHSGFYSMQCWIFALHIYMNQRTFELIKLIK